MLSCTMVLHLHHAGIGIGSCDRGIVTMVVCQDIVTFGSVHKYLYLNRD